MKYIYCCLKSLEESIVGVSVQLHQTALAFLEGSSVVEISSRNFPGDKRRPVHGANNVTAIYELTV
jgi:hypothetical protein